MLKINDERNVQTKRFDELNCGDIFIDPDDHDVCIKINDYSDEDNSFSFDHRVTFPKCPDEKVIPIYDAVLTIR